MDVSEGKQNNVEKTQRKTLPALRVQSWYVSPALTCVGGGMHPAQLCLNTPRIPRHSAHTTRWARWPHCFMVIASGSASSMVQGLLNSISGPGAARQAGRAVWWDPKEPLKLIYHQQHPYSCHSATGRPPDSTRAKRLPGFHVEWLMH